MNAQHSVLAQHAVCSESFRCRNARCDRVTHTRDVLKSQTAMYLVAEAIFSCQRKAGLFDRLFDRYKSSAVERTLQGKSKSGCNDRGGARLRHPPHDD